MDDARKILPDITYCGSAYEAAEEADALLIITDWREFKQLNMRRIKELMRHPLIFDGRNIYEPGKLRSSGFEYYGIGQGNNKMDNSVGTNII